MQKTGIHENKSGNPCKNRKSIQKNPGIHAKNLGIHEKKTKKNCKSMQKTGIHEKKSGNACKNRKSMQKKFENPCKKI